MTTGRRPFEIHVGERPPDFWTSEEERIAVSKVVPIQVLAAHQRGKDYRRPVLCAETFPWQSIGAVPRFVGSETTSCAAALQPQMWHDKVEGFERYVAAAGHRGDVALVVSMLGDLDPEAMLRRSVFAADASVELPDMSGSISGRRLPPGASAAVAPGLRGADRDLALRLLGRGADAPWWKMGPSPLTLYRGDGSGEETREPGGVFEPLLVNELGEILAGVWRPDEKNWRWYVVPGGTDWQDVVEWLVDQAIPEFVPNALRRVRAAELVDDLLLTPRELAARKALADFENALERQRAALQDTLAEAQTNARDIRLGLLYGTGAPLVSAVRVVFEAAGFQVADLDALLGKTDSADLLVSKEGRHWLVEVKASAGNPKEKLVGDLDRHVQTWPALKRPEAVDGGVLVVNHQHNLAPLDRAEQAFTREAFVDALRYTVLPTLALFAWWRDSDLRPVTEAVTGPARCYAAALGERPQTDSRSVEAQETHAIPRTRGWWPRRRK